MPLPQFANAVLQIGPAIVLAPDIQGVNAGVQNFSEIGRDKWSFPYMLIGPLRPYGLAVRTPPFHGGSPGSIPGRVAIFFPPFFP